MVKKKKKKKKIEWGTPEGESGKNAQKILLEVVDNQIRDNSPPEANLTFQRLLKEGYSKVDAKKLIAAVLAKEFFEIMNKKEGHNLERYVSALNSLPDSAWE